MTGAPLESCDTTSGICIATAERPPDRPRVDVASPSVAFVAPGRLAAKLLFSAAIARVWSAVSPVALPRASISAFCRLYARA